MTSPENAANQFLAQLYTLTSGDMAAQQSMHDVGAALGLDKAQSGKVAEDLIGKGLVEIKTLSGGVGITAEGVKAIQASGGSPHDAAGLSLGSGRIVETEGCATLDRLLTNIKSEITQCETPFTRLEEIVMDIKTIETQMLSPQPKTAVIKAVLDSLKQALAKAGISDMANRVEQIIKA